MCLCIVPEAIVVYHNGFAQPIDGGNIVVHGNK
jgi:hypothetical protein